MTASPACVFQVPAVPRHGVRAARDQRAQPRQAGRIDPAHVAGQDRHIQVLPLGLERERPEQVVRLVPLDGVDRDVHGRVTSRTSMTQCRQCGSGRKLCERILFVVGRGKGAARSNDGRIPPLGESHQTKS